MPIVSLSADHTSVLYAKSDGPIYTGFAVYTVGSRTCLASLSPLDIDATLLLLAPDNSHIAVALRSGVIRLYRMEAGAFVLVGSSNKHKTNIRSMKFTPDGQTLCSMDGDGFVCFLKVGHLLSH